MASEPSSLTLSHAQPLPKRPAAAALNLDFASSMLPNAESANTVHQHGCPMQREPAQLQDASRSRPKSFPTDGRLQLGGWTIVVAVLAQHLPKELQDMNLAVRPAALRTSGSRRWTTPRSIMTQGVKGDAVRTLWL